MKRKIVQIDEAKCDGCGVCVPNCVEGALQIIDGKARLISDLFCDGLGACLGHCPQGAITIEEREAELYDERKVMDYIVKGGQNVILAHLKHLQDHNEIKFLKEALEYLNENNIPVPDYLQNKTLHHVGCPGSRNQEIKKSVVAFESGEKRNSQLTHWPIQLHLINPTAVHFHNADILLAADCCAFSYGDFHYDFLNGKKLAIACPKLDTGKEIYLKKLSMMIEEANINSLTVMIMEVPCCRGLLQLAQQAIQLSGKDIPLKVVVISIQGEVMMEDEI
ncbi:MAG: 4Fe-4S ferredoxin [Ignavibacteriales bacterium]|nr:MAG: 4Fe-4S ferredoxin [Ignavibacteriales bacterium]